MTRPEKDTRSLPELFAAATDRTLEDDEGDWGDWSAVRTLHFLGSREVFDGAAALARSENPWERERGADILAQLGMPHRSFPDECIRLVTDLLERDPDPLVLYSAAIALGHLNGPINGPIEPLLRHARHEDSGVRFAVAWALGGHSEPEAVAALIRLTEDEDSEVRDWATFGLGDIGTVDSPEVREALFRRLDDEDEDTRFEAICGLARCRDLRVLGLVREALIEEPENSFLHEAALRLLGLEDSYYEDDRKLELTSERLIELLDDIRASES